MSRSTPPTLIRYTTFMQSYIQLLKEFIAIKSISTNSAYGGEILDAAKWLQKQFEDHGFEVTQLTSPDCNPVIVARYNAGKPTTTLVYGHYDVQPAELEQGWSGDPFTLREHKGRLLGRGVVDNKGQVLIHMSTVFEHISQGTLASNIIFLIEGNEETANPVLADLVAANRKLLDCDQVIISDGEIMGERPVIEASLRGGFNLKVQLRTGTTDLHSGIAGGAVPNAANVLAHLLTTLSDETGKVLVAGFYDDMQLIAAAVAKANAANARNVIPKHHGVQRFLMADDTDFYTQTGLYPTLQITGITSGYTGEGFANIVPATAEVRLNARTVPGQDPNKLMVALQDHLQQHVPDYAELSLSTGEEGHDAVVLDTNGPVAQRAQRLLEAAYGTKPAIKYVGGSIPIVADFQRIFKTDPLLIGLGNDDCNMHGADENFRLDLIEKGLRFSTAWFGPDA